MDLQLTLDGDGDLTARLYRSLRQRIVDGTLTAGEQLPPSRELAARLQLSRTTVTTAYERLVAEGYLTARVGAGTFVAAAAAAIGRRPPGTAGVLRPRAGWSVAPQPTSGMRPPPRHDLRAGIPDAGLFPFDTWRRLLAAEWRRGANHPGGYADPAGHAGLRDAIARYVGYARAVRCRADDVVVTSGAQQALDLSARVLLAPGAVVAVEEPGYAPARDLFATHGVTVVGVPVDGDGLVVDALPDAARLVYTTPSHQFPLGVAMSLERRAALVAWAAEHDAAIVEDDYDSEFRFADCPLEPLHSLDPAGRVLYVGTFSKTLLPALRLGFVVVPPGLRRAVRAARQLTDAHGPPALQAALARLMDDGLLARHIRRATRVYGQRRAAVVAALDQRMADVLARYPSSAGLHVTAALRAGDAALADAVVAGAARRGIALASLREHCQGDPPAGLVLGYGAADPATLADGLAAFEQVLRRELQRA